MPNARQSIKYLQNLTVKLQYLVCFCSDLYLEPQPQSQCCNCKRLYLLWSRQTRSDFLRARCKVSLCLIQTLRFVLQSLGASNTQLGVCASDRCSKDEVKVLLQEGTILTLLINFKVIFSYMKHEHFQDRIFALLLSRVFEKIFSCSLKQYSVIFQFNQSTSITL